MNGLAQPRNGNTRNAFGFKVLISVLSLTIGAGVLAAFNMSHTLVRLDERFVGFDTRLKKIERYQEVQIEHLYNAPGIYDRF